jgi:hypothetical protein
MADLSQIVIEGVKLLLKNIKSAALKVNDELGAFAWAAFY